MMKSRPKLDAYLEVEKRANQGEKHRTEDQLPTLVQISDGLTGRSGSRRGLKGRAICAAADAGGVGDAHTVHWPQ
jgi:hypothetical protein